jgi:predicted glutamine amidotransferase
MCRLVGWVSPEPVTLRDVIGETAVERLLRLSTVHRHGWGAAWHEGAGRADLHVRRAAAPAAEDRNFRELVDTVAATSAVVHLRMGTPGYGRTTVDTHPFADADWALIHNGAVAPPDLVDRLLAANSARRPEGSTDSERWFLALRDEIDRGRSVPDAVTAVLDRAHSAGLHGSSWNSMLLGPSAMHVVVHHDHALLPVDIQLWPDAYPEEIVCWPPYFDLRLQQNDAFTTVASSGIVEDTTGWALLPNMSVLRLGFDTAEPETVVLPPSAVRPATVQV